jgi:SAM-dependent methyltransferase
MTSRVKREISKESWDQYYRRYQYVLAHRYLIPLLIQWGVDLDGKRLLEVGCGDGGCGAAFHDLGCIVTMMDLDERLVSLAERFNDEKGLNIKTFAGDIFDEHGEVYKQGPFDIVMFRDVMEHLDEPDRALEIAARNLSGGGVILVVFPPYYSPYGAHQQILPRKMIGPIPYNKLPYIQLLPHRIFSAIVGGEGAANREVQRLRGIRLTLGRFEGSADRAGFKIRRKKLYLSRPTFALRYGIPVIEASILGKVPLLNELVVTAGYYLLEPAEG